MRSLLLISVMAFGMPPLHSAAQPGSDLLGFDAGSGSVPLWTEAPADEVRDLSAIVQEMRPSIFLVGTPDGGHGTAFVISQENRLLATNAHVADIMNETGGEMLAISNGTTKIYEVEEAYYHPGVRRIVGGMVVRDSDSQQGDVYPHSPDVAILRIKAGEELPPELKLARPDDLSRLLAKPIGMMGFPGHDTSWPELGRKPEATFRQGVICRATDFANSVDVPADELQFIQHSMASWPGFSGSPIFLSNGDVVAIHNSGRSLERDGSRTSMAFGIRVDCLWEALKQHDLLGEVAVKVDPDAVDVKRFAEVDPALEALNEVRRLISLARIDLMRKNPLAAAERCTEVIEALPNYAEAYDVRCIAYNFHVNHEVNARNGEAKKYYEMALADASKAAELDPSSADHYLDVAVSMINLKSIEAPAGSYAYSEDSIKIAEKIIAMDGVRSRDRAYAYRLKAFASAWEAKSLGDIENAIKTDPWIPQNYTSLATYWILQRNPEKQKAAQLEAERLMSAIADGDQAWLAATSHNADHRNGADALRLAKQACEATDYRWWGGLKSLAAAHAELGEFDQALECAAKAIDLAPPEEADSIAKQRRAYESRKAWRDRG